MKVYLGVILALLIFVAGLFGWFMLHVADCFNTAANALTAAAYDYRDASQHYQAEKLRVGMALTQLEKDTMRLRTYLQKKGG